MLAAAVVPGNRDRRGGGGGSAGGYGDFIFQTEVERVTRMKTKSRRLVSFLIDIAIAHMAVCVDGAADRQRDPQGPVVASAILRLLDAGAFGWTHARL